MLLSKFLIKFRSWNLGCYSCWRWRTTIVRSLLCVFQFGTRQWLDDCRVFSIVARGNGFLLSLGQGVPSPHHKELCQKLSWRHMTRPWDPHNVNVSALWGTFFDYVSRKTPGEDVGGAPREMAHGQGQFAVQIVAERPSSCALPENPWWNLRYAFSLCLPYVSCTRQTLVLPWCLPNKVIISYMQINLFRCIYA
jgi:hypothetical protein